MINDLDLILKIKENFKDKVSKGHILDWGKLTSTYIHDMSPEAKELLHKWYQNILSYDFLKDLPASFEEVFIHNADDIKIKSNSGLVSYHQEMTSEDIDLCFEIICIRNKIDWNYNQPFSSFYLQINDYHFRATLIHKKINPEGRSKYFLRLINKRGFEIENFKVSKILFEQKIINKKNILIAGATGSGKTSFINTLINYVPNKDHLIILEDTYELQTEKENTTRLISSKDSQQSLDKLLTYSLRMSPDRIILGELRSFEISTFIQALNTGHKGVLSTIHANSAKDAIHRAANLYQLYSGVNMNYELALKLVSSNIDYVVFLENKEVKQVINVYSSEGANLFFDEEYDEAI